MQPVSTTFQETVMSLEMKYFILKPRAKSKTDKYAEASQAAMYTYADFIEEEDPDLANELRSWVGKEVARMMQTL